MPFDERVWAGDMPADAELATEAYSSISVDYPEVYAEAAFTSDYSALEVFVVGSESGVHQEFARRLVQSGAAEYPVILYPTQFSAADYQAAMNDMRSRIGAGQIIEWYPDVFKEAIVARTNGGAGLAVSLEEEINGGKDEGRKGKPSIPIEVRYIEGLKPGTFDATRFDDYAPFKMGTSIGPASSWGTTEGGN